MSWSVVLYARKLTVVLFQVHTAFVSVVHAEGQYLVVYAKAVLDCLLCCPDVHSSFLVILCFGASTGMHEHEELS